LYTQNIQNGRPEQRQYETHRKIEPAKATLKGGKPTSVC